MTDEADTTDLRRVPTGVPGLDTILNGGLLPARIYMLMGRPGAGKTIMGNQIAFNYVASGGKALYVTLLTESHARLLGSIAQFEFFEAKYLPTSISYLSGYQALQNEINPLDELLALLSDAVRKHGATMLVIDGLVTAGAVAKSDIALKKFIYGLQVLIELVGCTTLVLTGSKAGDSNYAERTMVDGLFELATKRVGMRTVREIEVLKFRGSAHVLGGNSFEITDVGITVYPRSEAILGRGEAKPARAVAPLSLGNEGLDGLFAGALESGSATLILGPPGTGKTLLGLQLLCAGVARREPGLAFGFFEDAPSLLAKSRRIGLWPRKAADQALIELVWQPPAEQIADALATRLLSTIKTRGIRRLFIDGWAGFEDALVYPERRDPFFAALVDELRGLGVTTFISKDIAEAAPTAMQLSLGNLPALADNVLLLRRLEGPEGVSRFVSVLKMRHGDHDASLHEFSIAAGGLRIAKPARKISAPSRSRAKRK
jgi:circadian clock protein KaiC